MASRVVPMASFSTARVTVRLDAFRNWRRMSLLPSRHLHAKVVHLAPIATVADLQRTMSTASATASKPNVTVLRGIGAHVRCSSTHGQHDSNTKLSNNSNYTESSEDSLQVLYGDGLTQSDEHSRGVVVAARSRPLSILSELTLYQSSIDIGAVMAQAQFRCQMGAGLAACGFATMLASVATSVPTPAFLMLMGGALTNSYMLAMMSQRVIRRTAMRHVERLIVFPTATSSDEKEGAVNDKANPLETLLSEAATVQERLAATKELRLFVRTAGEERWFSLVDREEACGETEGEDIGSHDDRATFGDLCTRLRLLHIDVTTGTCSDPSMLDALVTSAKVATDERAEVHRDDVPAGPMLSEVTLSEVVQAESGAPTNAPADAIARLGWRAQLGGVSVLGAGILFGVGEASRDADGVARWTNLFQLLPFTLFP